MRWTIDIIKEKHDKFNSMYFDGKLTTPEFRLIPYKYKFPDGRCVPHKKNGKRTATIEMSKRIKDEAFFDNVLIHEMIHQYVYERLHGCNFYIIQHGIKFHYVKWRLKRKYRLRIRLRIS